MTEDPIALKKRNAQELYARGLIGPDDYEALGRQHGFVSPAPKSRAKQVLTYSGYVALATGAAAEIAIRQWPQLKGPPIEFLIKVAESLFGALLGS